MSESEERKTPSLAGSPRVTDHDPITGQKTDVVFTEIESPTHEQAKELLAYWQERMEKGGFVMGRDIPARQIGHLMKHLVVREPVEGGRDFRNRLVGTVLMERLGGDVTGLRISEVYAAASANALIASLKKAIDTGKPVFQRAEVHGMVDTIRTAEGVLLPMKAPDGVTNWTLNGVFYL